jgi:hypothetical protein
VRQNRDITETRATKATKAKDRKSFVSFVSSRQKKQGEAKIAFASLKLFYASGARFCWENFQGGGGVCGSNAPGVRRPRKQLDLFFAIVRRRWGRGRSD